MRKQLVLYVFLALFMIAGRAEAITYSFECITNNNTGDCDIGEAQLFLDVSPSVDNTVSFLFYNSGPEASVIEALYFDDSIPLFSGIYGINDSMAFVDFEEGASPPVLPGGNGPPWFFNVTDAADAESPSPLWGVGPGEEVEILMSLMDGYSFDSVLSAMASSDLRIGIHVQAFDSGGSESFINNGVIPEPATMLLFGTGLAGLAGISRRRKK